MISQKNLFRSCILLLVMLGGVTTVSAWTLQGWSATVRDSPAQPGTPVSLSYAISFDSWMTGTTFDAQNSLVMYTDLANPQWTVAKTETMDDSTQIVTPISVRQSMQVRLDGWSLSFSRKQFDLTVQLSGTVPALNQSQNISLVRVQEMDPDAKMVSGSQVRKEIPVYVPAPATIATTPEPAPQDTIIDVTMEPTAPAVSTGTTGPVPVTPTRRTTYSPGPDPLLICGMLAGLVVLWARTARGR
jgi:hypothetical protein